LSFLFFSKQPIFKSGCFLDWIIKNEAAIKIKIIKNESNQKQKAAK